MKIDNQCSLTMTLHLNVCTVECPIMHPVESNAIEFSVPLLRKHGIILLEAITLRSTNGVTSSSPVVSYFNVPCSPLFLLEKKTLST